MPSVKVAKLSKPRLEEEQKADDNSSASPKGHKRERPSPPSSGAEPSDSASDEHEIDSKPAKRRKTATKPRKSAAPRKEVAANRTPWTRAQVRQLFEGIVVLPERISWRDVAAGVNGRDEIMCRDKWKRVILPKLQAFIESLGE